MKVKRQAKLLEIIADHKIDTQEGLTDALKAEGYEVAQATISRDIQELNLVKVRCNDGGFRYVSQNNTSNVGMVDKFVTIFRESIKETVCAQNMIVVKCYTGMANAACAALDTAEIEEIVGTLSGDDTFVIITKTLEDAISVKERLDNILNI